MSSHRACERYGRMWWKGAVCGGEKKEKKTIKENNLQQNGLVFGEFH
jgi:hypothetical protein